MPESFRNIHTEGNQRYNEHVAESYQRDQSNPAVFARLERHQLQ